MVPNTVEDAMFLLTHVLNLDEKPWLDIIPSEAERTAILTAAEEFFREELAPLRRSGDAICCPETGPFGAGKFQFRMVGRFDGADDETYEILGGADCLRVAQTAVKAKLREGR